MREAGDADAGSGKTIRDVVRGGLPLDRRVDGQHDLGEIGGSETVTLLDSEVPAHSHQMSVSSQLGLENQVNAGGAGQMFAMGDGINLYSPVSSLVAMAPTALSVAGASFPHNNMQPYLTLNFNIALQGVFPPRG